VSAIPVSPFDLPEPPDWRKDRKLAGKGFADLEYLPRARAGWNATLAAYAYSVRRQADGQADLNLWAAMHARPTSARYEQYGRNALVLWHGTSAVRAEKIRRVGLFPRKGIWATTEPRLAHSFTRGRSTEYGAGSAMIVLVFDKENIDVPFEMASEHDTLRFRSPVGPEWIEYVLWDDRIEFLGKRKAASPKPWGVARFAKRHGKWVPQSRPPVRFDPEQTYDDLTGWLELGIRRVLKTLGAASAIEVFSSLYATIGPWEALEHGEILAALERLCGRPRQKRGGMKHFSLKDPTA